MTLQFHEEASREFAQAVRWYLERSPDAAQHLRNQVSALSLRIIDSPEVFPRTTYGRRKALLDRFPYALIFEWRPDSICIIAVAHAKRHPGYWRRRSMPNLSASDVL